MGRRRPPVPARRRPTPHNDAHDALLPPSCRLMCHLRDFRDAHQPYRLVLPVTEAAAAAEWASVQRAGAHTRSPVLGRLPRVPHTLQRFQGARDVFAGCAIDKIEPDAVTSGEIDPPARGRNVLANTADSECAGLNVVPGPAREGGRDVARDNCRRILLILAVQAHVSTVAREGRPGRRSGHC